MSYAQLPRTSFAHRFCEHIFLSACICDPDSTLRLDASELHCNRGSRALSRCAATVVQNAQILAFDSSQKFN